MISSSLSIRKRADFKQRKLSDVFGNCQTRRSHLQLKSSSPSTFHIVIWPDLNPLWKNTGLEANKYLNRHTSLHARTHTHVCLHTWFGFACLCYIPFQCTVYCFLYKPENCNHIPVWRVTEHEKILVCGDWRVQIKTIYEPKSSKFFTWRCTLLSYKGHLLTLLSLQQ